MEDATGRTRWISSFLVKRMPPMTCPYTLFLPTASTCISVWGFLLLQEPALLSIQQALGAALTSDQLQLVYQYPSSPPPRWANSVLCFTTPRALHSGNLIMHWPLPILASLPHPPTRIPGITSHMCYLLLILGSRSASEGPLKWQCSPFHGLFPVLTPLQLQDLRTPGNSPSIRSQRGTSCWLTAPLTSYSHPSVCPSHAFSWY